MMEPNILTHPYQSTLAYRCAAAVLAPLALIAMAGAASAQTPPPTSPSAALAPLPAQATALSPEQIVKRHMAAKSDIDAIMADYADDAVVLQNGQALIGKPAIRAQFEKLFPKPPAGATSGAPAPSPMSGMQVKRIWQQGNVGFLTWEMGPIHTTEEFVVRDGKIAVQAIFMRGHGLPATAEK